MSQRTTAPSDPAVQRWFLVTFHRTETYGTRRTTVHRECGPYDSLRHAENQAFLRAERRMRAVRGRVLWAVVRTVALAGPAPAAPRPRRRDARLPVFEAKLYRGVLQCTPLAGRPVRTVYRTLVAMSRQQASRTLDAMVEEANRSPRRPGERWHRHGIVVVEVALERPPVRVLHGSAPLAQRTSRSVRTR